MKHLAFQPKHTPTAALTAAGYPHQIGSLWASEAAYISCLLQIYLDVGVASSAFKPAGQRTLGDKTVLPNDAEPVGRIVIGVLLALAGAFCSDGVAVARLASSSCTAAHCKQFAIRAALLVSGSHLCQAPSEYHY